MSVTLADALALLNPLTYDELTDLVDVIDWWHKTLHIHERRKGKRPIEAIEPYAQYYLLSAIKAARELSQDDRIALSSTAQMLAAALAPREYRKRNWLGQPLARGTVQVKYIKKMLITMNGDAWIDPETGEQGFKIHGPYLYLRVWATGGGKDRRQKRLKNKYIGMTGLASRYERGEVTADQIIDAYHAGTLGEL